MVTQSILLPEPNIQSQAMSRTPVRVRASWRARQGSHRPLGRRRGFESLFASAVTRLVHRTLRYANAYLYAFFFFFSLV